MRTATCDVCTAYIADVQPVPGIAPDGTAQDDRIGDLRIVCDDCAKTYEVIVRGKGVQPPDGTTERDAFAGLLEQAEVFIDAAIWAAGKLNVEAGMKDAGDQSGALAGAVQRPRGTTER